MHPRDIPDDMRKRFYLMDNPKAGHGSRELVANVVAGLSAKGCEVVSMQPAGCEAAQAAAVAAAGSGDFDAVLAAGGDGTIRLAAKAVLGTRTPLGAIPLGTGNVLAHETGLPRTPAAIVELMVSGAARDVGIATCNGEPFLLMAGAGFDGSVIKALDHTLKSRVGKLAYLGPGVRALASPPSEIHADIDGEGLVANWIVIARARRYGGKFVIAEKAGIEKPGLVAVLIDATSPAELALTLMALASGRLGRRSNVRTRTCTSAVLRSAAPVPVQIDGDTFGETPVTVESGQSVIKLILPPK